MAMEYELKPTTWRFLQTPPSRGAWNMALDEAILEAVGRQKAPPTLRVYAWNPPCLSLGYSQPVSDVDLESLEENEWEIVRRPTGGRAILHTDELTYSVIAPPHEPRVVGSVLESYCRLAQALLAALEKIGLEPYAGSQYNPPPGTQPRGAVCFEVPSNYEITVAGKKLVGSAQARRREGVLQHGSLPLWGDLTRITRALRYKDDLSRRKAAERLLAHAANVEMLGKKVTWEQCAEAFQDAFAEKLNLQFEVQPLTEWELKRAEELVAKKYNHPTWTQRIP